jgi:hypothetical protein
VIRYKLPVYNNGLVHNNSCTFTHIKLSLISHLYWHLTFYLIFSMQLTLDKRELTKGQYERVAITKSSCDLNDLLYRRIKVIEPAHFSLSFLRTHGMSYALLLALARSKPSANRWRSSRINSMISSRNNVR